MTTGCYADGGHDNEPGDTCANCGEPLTPNVCEPCFRTPEGREQKIDQAVRDHFDERHLDTPVMRTPHPDDLLPCVVDGCEVQVPLSYPYCPAHAGHRRLRDPEVYSQAVRDRAAALRAKHDDHGFLGTPQDWPETPTAPASPPPDLDPGATP